MAKRDGFSNEEMRDLTASLAKLRQQVMDGDLTQEILDAFIEMRIDERDVVVKFARMSPKEREPIIELIKHRARRVELVEGKNYGCCHDPSNDSFDNRLDYPVGNGLS